MDPGSSRPAAPLRAGAAGLSAIPNPSGRSGGALRK